MIKKDKIFIGVDESYDMSVGGNFILNFFMIFSEKDAEGISIFIKDFLNKNLKEEIKYDKTSKLNISKIIKKLNDFEYLNLFVKTEITDTKNILKYNYKKSIDIFSEYIKSNYRESQINIKIDTIAGEKFQKECISILKEVSNRKNIKTKFVSSKTNELIQISDLFAAVNRLEDKNKILNIKKNKSL